MYVVLFYHTTYRNTRWRTLGVMRFSDSYYNSVTCFSKTSQMLPDGSQMVPDGSQMPPR